MYCSRYWQRVLRIEVKVFNGDLVSSCGWKERDRKKEGCGSTYYDLDVGGWVPGEEFNLGGEGVDWQRGHDAKTGVKLR